MCTSRWRASYKLFTMNSCFMFGFVINYHWRAVVNFGKDFTFKKNCCQRHFYTTGDHDGMNLNNLDQVMMHWWFHALLEKPMKCWPQLTLLLAFQCNHCFLFSQWSKKLSIYNRRCCTPYAAAYLQCCPVSPGLHRNLWTACTVLWRVIWLFRWSPFLALAWGDQIKDLLNSYSIRYKTETGEAW